ncbi:MAG: OB-fold nucleic acid binding domain-containing protein, partial [Clostridia bacterium]|nr:OB-fold nucleic acid binding domain-containing protein [Clostridia bacterium]
MQKMTVRELYARTPDSALADIQVSGWVRTVRDSKSFAFVALSDGTHFKPLQIVLEESALNNYKEVARLNVGSAIEAVGTLVPTPGMQQPFELKAERVTVVGGSSPEYPLQKKQHSVEFLRTIAHLRPRTNLFSAVFRIRSLAAQIIHDFFYQKNFVYVHTPIITTSDCEGAGEVFRLTTLDPANAPRNADGTVDYAKDFFGKEVGLSVSGQLNVESFCMAFRDVYTFGPTFRAER